jgi:hypothetical protein
VKRGPSGWLVTGELQGWQFRIDVVAAGLRISASAAGRGDAGHRRNHHADMSLFPDQPPPVSPPEKPKMSAEERRARQADRLTTIRLRMAIGRELDDRDITTPAAIGAALGMPAAEATKLLRGHQWRQGDVARLQAAAARLGLQVPSL